MNEDTSPCTLTADLVHACSKEAEDELERFLGTAEHWGAVLREKPCLSSKASVPSDLLKESL